MYLLDPETRSLQRTSDFAPTEMRSDRSNHISSKCFQSTVSDEVRWSGKGIHFGENATVRLTPAPENTGILFISTNNEARRPVCIPANIDYVSARSLHTIITHDGTSVATVEHLLAACAFVGVTNAVIHVDGPEIPHLDGSSKYFVDAMLERGIEQQTRGVRALVVNREITASNGDAWVKVMPNSGDFSDVVSLDITIDFAEASIGRQNYSRTLAVSELSLLQDELAAARTFCTRANVDTILKMGLGKGATLENSLVFEPDRSPSLRYPDECVRHKVLDTIGDFSLAGAVVCGLIQSYRPSHQLNLACVSALLSDPTAYDVIELNS